MSYKLKTLIVFDTNSLRSTEAGEVAYSFFAFGKPFQVIEEFIKDKNLSGDIHIAIPSWAIEELKDQKHKQYQEDIVKFQTLAKRLSGLPHIPEIKLTEEEFDCASYVSEKATAFIATKSIKLLEINEGVASTVLKSMMTRVMRDEHKKSPFVHSGKFKDAGFKDNIVWESLMNFEEVKEYDKVIFLTKDGDFNRHCKAEFEEKWKKHISILKDENAVLTEIQVDFKDYLDLEEIDRFARSEYFIGKLNEELSHYNTVYPIGIIKEIKITNPCSYAQTIPPDDDGNENIMISSDVLVQYEWDGEMETMESGITTYLEDRASKEIIDMMVDQRLQ